MATERSISELKSQGLIKHHWVIEPPNGPTSEAVCKMHGEIRRYHNAFEDTIREGRNPLKYKVFQGYLLR